MFVVGAPEYYGPDFNPRQFGAGGPRFERRPKFVAPATVHSIHSSNLLLDHTWIPLWMEQDHDPAGLMQIQAFPAN